ncbi:hypothetical protein [Paenibacillus sp. FSL R7-0273]|uniref:hypothetical protein n=1 Tax=Paenibacillus sp. FSL R7-0273 TaxID=1536772 RepID=UPI0035560F83
MFLISAVITACRKEYSTYPPASSRDDSSLSPATWAPSASTGIDAASCRKNSVSASWRKAGDQQAEAACSPPRRREPIGRGGIAPGTIPPVAISSSANRAAAAQ